jgi:hypothetical protein
MADNFWGEIEIGGPVPRSIVPRLLEFAREPATGYTADELTTANLPRLFKEFDAATGYLHLEDPDARYGQFEDLETFLLETSIGYNRRSDGKYEFTPEEARFRPGMDGPTFRLMSHEHAPLVDLHEVEQARQLLEAGCVSKALAKLREVIGPDVPELPPLEILD